MDDSLLAGINKLSGQISGVNFMVKALVDSLDDNAAKRLAEYWAQAKAEAMTEMLMALPRDGLNLDYFRHGFESSIREVEKSLASRLET